MRNGKISMPNMITHLVEDRQRNQMLVQLVKKASAGNRQLLVLSDRRLHCEFLHQCFPKTSGLYMGGMKEAALHESSKRKSYSPHSVKPMKASISQHSIQLSYPPLSQTFNSLSGELWGKRRVRRTTHIYTMYTTLVSLHCNVLQENESV